ncbi:MAG: gliding motility-associated C-terminal domain-containing protein [Flavobacteriales bacterium]|nr:gliding motility-associated C-terminal domain-containing protein [Flavobacteriales bacterium]
MQRSLCSAFFLVLIGAQAQNLVPNGDLEQYTQCPDYVSQIDRAVGWSRPTQGTSDYLNACLGVPFSESVPDNEFGYEPAHSGNGYAGFYCFYSTTAISTAPDNDHEYVTHALSAPLTPGTTYAVEFFVSLADVSKYAVNDIGALFSVNVPVRTDDLAITATPQITNSSLAMLNNKNGWTRIHGCFVADSAFAYITVGNFHAGPATTFEEVATDFPLTYYSYYYVDDVSVQAVAAPQLGPDINACDAVTLAVQDPVDGATYLWSTGAEGSSIVVDTAGVYSVAMDVDGCLLTDTINVQLAEPITLTLAGDTTADFCATPFLLIDPGPLPPNTNVIWSTGATTTTIQVDQAGLYTVNASAPEYCPATAAMLVVDACGSPVYAPNAFTPNNDGINDSWMPVWLANTGATLEVQVFDRWGRTLFAATELDAAWDGTTDGSPIPDGVYAWRGQTRDPATSTLRVLFGHVSVMR